MEPPIIMESFETLSKKEAEILFDWFVNQIPLRVLENVTN